MRYLLCLIAIFHTILADTRAAEPFFKPGDVVALVGGEDMVVAAELGYLETLIQLALPDHKLKFRSLAREGDTVFEQRRDLNYPTLEAQLDKIGATVVICQFGQMESLAAARAVDGIDRVDAMDKVDAVNGTKPVHEVHKVQPVQEKADALRKAKVAEFVAAYEKLIGRLSGGGKRRMILVSPTPWTGLGSVNPDAAHRRFAEIRDYSIAIDNLAKQAGHQRFGFENLINGDSPNKANPDALAKAEAQHSRNGLHYSNESHRSLAMMFFASLKMNGEIPSGDRVSLQKIYTDSQTSGIRALIAAKNRLWFHYYRPQNWAFLAGDRTNQPSSRDHIDRNKRWFPEELEKFVPLIDAKDAEIWALAKKLAAQGGK